MAARAPPMKIRLDTESLVMESLPANGLFCCRSCANDCPEGGENLARATRSANQAEPDEQLTVRERHAEALLEQAVDERGGTGGQDHAHGPALAGADPEIGQAQSAHANATTSSALNAVAPS